MRFVVELSRLAHSIEVCTPVHPEGSEQGFSIESPCVRYRSLPPSRTIEQFVRRFPGDGTRIVGQLYQGIRGADLVWINGPHPLLPLGALIARLLRKPYLLWLRGDILETTRSKYAGQGGRNGLALRAAFYLDRLILFAAKGAVVFYTGGGLERYAAKARYGRLANTSLVRDSQLAAGSKSCVHSPIRLLWAGQLRPVKGLPYLLGAVRALRDQGLSVSLTLVGDGEQREALEAAIERLGLQETVSLEGYLPPGPDLDAFFEQADLFVLPSLSEGVPKVLFEAMARALPVVASRVGGVPDVVTDGANGLLVPPADAEALVGAIRRLAEDSMLRARLSRGALEFARGHTTAAEVERIHEGVTAAFPGLLR